MDWLNELEVGDEVMIVDPVLGTSTPSTVIFITPARQRISAGNTTFSGKTGIQLAQQLHIARRLSPCKP